MPANPTPSPEAKPAPSLATATPEWKEYVSDPTKSADENTAAKTAHDATKPAAPTSVALAPLDFAKDIKLPEGITVDDGTRDTFTNLINDPKLSPAQRAQGLIDLQSKLLNEAAEGRSKAWDDLQTSWQDTVRKDPEVGGAKLPVVQQNIGKLLDTYGATRPDKGVGLRAVFETTGAGNNLESIRFLNWVASKLNEGGPAPTPQPPTNSDQAKIMFPSMN